VLANQLCRVPIQVSSAPGLYGKAATMAVSRNGSQCTDRSDGTAAFRNRISTMATVGLVHADVDMGAKRKDLFVQEPPFAAPKYPPQTILARFVARIIAY
jgi:hypothetical protein